MTPPMIDPTDSPAPAWHTHRVATFAGQHDTHIRTGEDYATLTLADIFAMAPARKAKGASPAFIPSSYADFNAREHAKQRECGSYVALCGDVDSGDHDIGHITDLTGAIAGDAAWLVYSSAHARPGDKRWRIILPLARPASFDDWNDAQEAFFAAMEASGVKMDHALARAAQPVYLPNVPDAHAKSETALRDSDGEPLYYERQSSDMTAPGFNIRDGAIGARIVNMRRARMEDEQHRARIRQEAEQRRANRADGDGSSLIVDFNASNSLATMLEICGYQQSPRHEEDWRSPNQTGDTYATRIIGDKWVSLSASDVGCGVGEKCKSGCFGDAYDLFVHYKHRGDHKAAFRALHAERRASQPNVIWGGWEAPPPLDESDPGWDGEPDWADEYVVDDGADAAPVDVPPTPLALIDPSSWAGTEAPERVWKVKDYIPDRQATLLTGKGAAGKSLVSQQQATCIALGLPFLGIETVQTNAIYITCEDDADELHRRQMAICANLGVDIADLSGKLFLLSLQGEMNNELATFDHDGRLHIAPRYKQIVAACDEFGIGFAVLDNTAHLFTGNENDRHQVASFINLCNRLAIAINGAVVIVGHPNKSGDSYSGSTAWENQVRSRLFMEIPLDDHGNAPDPDMRVMRREKVNYAQRGGELNFMWFKGSFVLPDTVPEERKIDTAGIAKASRENEIFLTCLAKATEHKRAVSHQNGINYAPRIFAHMPQSKGVKEADMRGAMERLLSIGQIMLEQPLWRGPNRVMKHGIVASKGGNSLHEPPLENGGKPCTDPARTPCTDPHEPLSQVIENTAPTLHCTNPHILCIEEGEALKAPPPSSSDDWTDNPILNSRGSADVIPIAPWIDEAPPIDETDPYFGGEYEPD